jgi:formate hydrogenlyase subunit 3/multisubunit Na+/H+ antiporter MnhD subunit
MTKIWAEAFWKDSPRQTGLVPVRRIQLVPVAILAAATILIGLGLGPIYALAQEAATQLGFPPSP